MSESNPYQSPRFGGVDYGVGFDRLQPRRPLASRLSRLGAHLLDTLIFAVILIPGIVMIRASEESEEIAFAGIALVLIAVVALGILQIVLLSTQGQTLGKRAVRVQIVCYDTDENPGFVKAVLLRVFVNGLIGAVPLIGPIYSLVNICFIFGDERRCIHDLIAGTQVVEA
jgi:uncharacterized RDD family membrane protein YckC